MAYILAYTTSIFGYKYNFYVYYVNHYDNLPLSINKYWTYEILGVYNIT